MKVPRGAVSSRGSLALPWPTKTRKRSRGDVRVDDRHPLPEREALHRTHRVRAQSLEGAEGCRVRGQPPTVFGYDFARDRVESSRTDVVSPAAARRGVA